MLILTGSGANSVLLKVEKPTSIPKNRGLKPRRPRFSRRRLSAVRWSDNITLIQLSMQLLLQSFHYLYHLLRFLVFLYF